MIRTRLIIFLILCIPLYCYLALFIIPFNVADDGENERYFNSYQIPEGKLPIFYREEYNIGILGLENLHPFDSEKYGRVFNLLVEAKLLQKNQIIQPPKPGRDILLKVHTESYLNSLQDSGRIAQIVEVLPLRFLPWKFIHSRVLQPMLYATVLKHKLQTAR